MSTYGTLTADGDTGEVKVTGPVSILAAGTWGGGTLTVSYLCKDGTYRALNTDVAMTSNATGQNSFKLAEKTPYYTVKATLAGATSPSLYWEFLGAVESA